MVVYSENEGLRLVSKNIQLTNTYLGIEVPVRFSLWFEYPVMTGKNEELVSDVKVRVASNSLH